MSDETRRVTFTIRLGFQIAFLLAIVLLPLTAISVARSAALTREAAARSEAALVGATLHAASREVQLIQEARGSVESLAGALPEVMNDIVACNRMLSSIKEISANYSLVAFVPMDGKIRCSSLGEEADVSQSPLSKQIIADGVPGFVVNREAKLSGTSILGVTHPVLSTEGKPLGYVSVSVPHTALTIPEPEDDPGAAPLELVTFDSEGVVLTATRWSDGYENALPANRSLKALVGTDPVSFTATAQNGMLRAFSVVPLVPGKLYAMGTWPSDMSGDPAARAAVAPYLFPVLMWFASLIVAWFAVERLVIRYIRKLRASAISFAGGNRMVGDITVPGASAEIRELAEAYESMTETILRDEAELEDMVHQKEVLLREVHHRVKNNLQLIASIMNMQMRRTHSTEAKQTLKDLQDRVMSLATIHRELYQTAGLSDVHSDELLSKIVRQITNMTDRPDRRLQVHTDLADIRMTPDQAVPLALLVAEAVTNAIKYASAPAGQPANLWVSLTRDPGMRATLRVRNTVSGRPRPDQGGETQTTTTEATGLGAQLVMAFALQLGGQVAREETEGIFDLKICFELRPLDEAEERQVTVTQSVVEPTG